MTLRQQQWKSGLWFLGPKVTNWTRLNCKWEEFVPHYPYTLTLIHTQEPTHGKNFWKKDDAVTTTIPLGVRLGSTTPIFLSGLFRLQLTQVPISWFPLVPLVSIFRFELGMSTKPVVLHLLQTRAVFTDSGFVGGKCANNGVHWRLSA